jgi:hypothetical protein
VAGSGVFSTSSSLISYLDVILCGKHGFSLLHEPRVFADLKDSSKSSALESLFIEKNLNRKPRFGIFTRCIKPLVVVPLSFEDLFMSI